MERHTFWAEAYHQLDDTGGAQVPDSGLEWTYSQEAYNTFPRYLVWEAILKGIERLVPQSSSALDEFRRALAAAGMRAQTMMTMNQGLPAISRSAMDEEREAFRTFVLTIPEVRLVEVEPLPLRRGFEEEELQRVWAILGQQWAVTTRDYWWPLRDGAPPEAAMAFHTDWFDDEKIAALRDVLINHGVALIWELREGAEWGCEQSVQSFHPAYNGEEGYWTSAGAEWLVYASHETSITLGGARLLRAFRQKFPDCDQFEYQGPMSTVDQRGSW
jgi:hypothetical protein